MKKNFLAKTKNGFNVYVIVESEHMLAHKNVKETEIAEAISLITYSEPFQMEMVDLGRIIGRDNCITITEQDDIRFECRPGRTTLSKLVYGREPEPTSLLTVGICKDDDGLNTVFTAFYGAKAPKELDDPRLKPEEREEAEKFWATHALVTEG